MEDVVFNIFKKPRLKRGTLIEGLPGIGLVGKLAADHIVEEFKTEKICDLYSPLFPPQVNVKEDCTVELVKNELYQTRLGRENVIILVGDFQGITPDSQYILSEKILDFSISLGVKRVITLGGYGTGDLTKEPRVFGAATSVNIVSEFKKYGVEFRSGGSIVGASGILLGMSKFKGLDGVCLMGETHGQIIDAQSAKSILKVLMKVFDIDIDLAKMDEKLKDTEEAISELTRLIEMERTGYMDMQDKNIGEVSKYIR